ncbi:MAG: UPF0179 family protein [Candidatus Helarchaeota archaeon]
MKEIITLIGKKQARIGYRFRYVGSVDECETCNDGLRKICQRNLEKRYVYEVIEVRKIKHECKVHNDEVVIVKVRPVPIKVAINSKFAHEGSIIKYSPINCNNLECEYYEFCIPIEFRKNLPKKLRIKKVKERKKGICKINSDFTIVEVEKI